jgi:hypothetical protein
MLFLASVIDHKVSDDPNDPLQRATDDHRKEVHRFAPSEEYNYISILEDINAILDLLFQLSPVLDRVLEDLASLTCDNPDIPSPADNDCPGTDPSRLDPFPSSPVQSDLLAGPDHTEPYLRPGPSTKNPVTKQSRLESSESCPVQSDLPTRPNRTEPCLRLGQFGQLESLPTDELPGLLGATVMSDRQSLHPKRHSQGKLQETFTIDHLRAEIGNLRKKSTNGSYFICQHDINTLFTRAVIVEVIRQCVHEYAVPNYLETDVVNRIFTEGKIVFGILIWKKWQHKLMSFIEHNALDSQLPLDVARAEEIAQSVGWDFAQCAQWEFLPITLKAGYHCHFRDEEILPFIEETPLGEGSSSIVFRMSIEPSLQTIFPQQVRFLQNSKMQTPNLCIRYSTDDRSLHSKKNFTEKHTSERRNRSPSNFRSPSNLGPPPTPQHCSTLNILYLQRILPLPIPTATNGSRAISAT